jgi:hypothetical protein
MNGFTFYLGTGTIVLLLIHESVWMAFDRVFVDRSHHLVRWTVKNSIRSSEAEDGLYEQV